MERNQIQNRVFFVLGIIFLIGSVYQLKKKQISSAKNTDFSITKKLNNKKSQKVEFIITKKANNNGSNPKDKNKQVYLNNSITKSNEENFDHLNSKSQRRMGIYHFNEGNKFLSKKNWKEAIKNYQMSLKHDEKIVEVYINLSVAQFRIENFEKAYLTLQKLRKFQPHNPSLYYNLACYYSLTNQLQSGIMAIQKAKKFGFKNFQMLKTDPDLENLKKKQIYLKWLSSL